MPPTKKRRRPAQLELPRPPTWGGRRVGAGRKPQGPRALPHVARPRHIAAHPVHVTLRIARGVPSLRGFEVFPAVSAALGAAHRDDYRVVHFSVQDDHLHLLVEASDKASLANGTRALGIRVARAVNGAARHQGRVIADRYHARPLRTPREVRFCLVYVLHNVHKHHGARVMTRLDPCSSAEWFDGYRGGAGALTDATGPTDSPRTWLLRVGWRRHGLLSPDEAPSGPHRRADHRQCSGTVASLPWHGPNLPDTCMTSAGRKSGATPRQA